MRARWRCSARRRRAQAGAPPSEGTEGPSLAPARLPPPVPCQTASRPRPAFSVRSPTMRAPMERRSEEHTSEPPVTNAHLVCRLLLEKKKPTLNHDDYTIILLSEHVFLSITIVPLLHI